MGGKKKLTIEFVRESFEKENYILLDATYINSKTKLNYECSIGHKHSISWVNWKAGYRCPYCAGNIKLTIGFVKESLEKEGYKLLSNEYINAYSNLNYICPKEHKHSISWNSWQQGHKCPSCAGNNKPAFELVKASFEAENYILLNTTYTNNSTKLKYICPEGHEHFINWSNWTQGQRCSICATIKNSGKGGSNWKGGIIERNVALYDTYASQINFCEETRRDPNEPILLQVKCTKCNVWFTPTLSNVTRRVNSLNSNNGENRFYCSDGCKHSCSIYKKVKYSADEKRSKTNTNFTSTELNVWSKEVLTRADYICEYCGALAEHAHHIQPKKLESFLALDPDNGVACCKSCHYKYGHSGECSTGALSAIMC